MNQGNGAVNGARRLDERTASIAARRAGQALRGTPEEAADALFDLAIDVALSSPARELEALFDRWEDYIRHLQRTRRAGLWRAFRYERLFRREGVPVDGQAETWEIAA